MVKIAHAFICLLLCTFVVPVAFASQNSGVKALHALAEKNKNTVAIDGDFIQVKYLAFMGVEVPSKGKLQYIAPDELNWFYTEPVKSGLLFKDGKAALWSSQTEIPTTDIITAAASPVNAANADTSADKKHDIQLQMTGPEAAVARAISKQVLQWTKLDAEAILKDFDVKLISQKPLILELTPKFGTYKDSIKKFEVEFSALEGYVQRLVVYDKDGDYSSIVFENIKYTRNEQ